MCLIPFEEVDLQWRNKQQQYVYNNGWFVSPKIIAPQQHQTPTTSSMHFFLQVSHPARLHAVCLEFWMLPHCHPLSDQRKKKNVAKGEGLPKKTPFEDCHHLKPLKGDMLGKAYRIAPETTSPKRLLKHPIPWPPHLWLAGPWWAGRLAFRLSGDTNPSSALCFWVDFWQGV